MIAFLRKSSMSEGGWYDALSVIVSNFLESSFGEKEVATALGTTTSVKKERPKSPQSSWYVSFAIFTTSSICAVMVGSAAVSTYKSSYFNH